MWSKIWKWFILPCLFFSIITALLTYPMVWHLNDSVLDGADPLLNTWILSWDAHVFTQNPLDLYNANDFYPYTNTLAYSETLLGQAIFSVPLIWLTHNPILATNIAWFLGFVLSGFGMYALMLHVNSDISGALVAGTIFAFNAFRFAHIFHLQNLSAQWIPLSLLFLDRLIKQRKNRDCYLLIISVNLQILSCYYYGLFLTVALAALLVFYFVKMRERFNKQLLIQLVLFASLTALIQIPLSIPYLEASRNLEFKRTIEDTIRGGADLTDFITAPPTNWLYGKVSATLRGKGWWEHITFPGITPLILIAIALLQRDKTTSRNYLGIFLLLGCMGFVLSLGPALRINEKIVTQYLPYRLLYNYIPGFQSIRQPARFHILTTLALSGLAGISTKKIAAQIRSKWATFGLVAIVIIFLAIENWHIPLEPIAVPIHENIPPVYHWLAEQPDDGPVLELPVLPDIGAVESPRLYYSTVHWKRLVNGYGGFFPPVYAYFLFFDKEFPEQPYDWIVGLGIRYVILHRDQYSAPELARIDATLPSFQNRLQLIAEFEQDQVFQVLQPATGAANEPLTYTFDNKIRLLGYAIDTPAPHPGDTIEIKLFWQALASIDKNHTVFVHVIAENQTLLTQDDGEPQAGERPTSTWVKDEVVLDVHTIQIPSETRPGSYRIKVGLYNLETLERLPLHVVDGIIAARIAPLGYLSIHPQHYKK